jgi:SAM-dependent methyltransferase
VLKELLEPVNPPGEIWPLGALPFQIGHQRTPSNAPLPDALPLTLALDHETGRLVQRADARVALSLAEAYRLGSQMGTPLRDEGVGSAQLEDLVSFVRGVLSDGDLQGLRVLEVGCGRGALLARLAELGARVVGVEPGEPAALAARERGLCVHCEPFTADRFETERFDLIVHHTVLEHIEEPREFITQQLALLASGGVIICGVPDCGPALRHGDLSILVHEHWSYFDVDTLGQLAASAGAATVACRRARTEGSIYTAWRPAASVAHAAPTPPPYFELAQRALRAVHDYMLTAARAGSTVGIFPGGRFINYLALAQRTLETLPVIRWFDDDPSAHGRFYPPITIPIEARDGLLADPVEEVLITSWTFGELLREQLAAERALRDTQIHVIADLL